MLRLKSPLCVRLITCTSTASLVLRWILSSKQSMQTQTHPQVLQFTQADQQDLLFLLLKHPTRCQSLQVHSQLVTTGFHQRVGRAGIIIWNTLLREYSVGMFPEEALNFYKQVHESSAYSLDLTDSFTYSFLLKACANLQQPTKGVQVHAHIIKMGFECHVYVQTALVNMYAVCGCLGEAKRVFDEMPDRNSVTWNAMITGFIKWGELKMAHSLFDRLLNRTVISWTGMIDGYTWMNQPMEALVLFI